MADRFQRIWSIVERIDGEPGLGRKQLAAEFALSERQLQADLELIRSDMGLPLLRQQGYRFDGQASPSESLSLQDAVVLSRLAQAAYDGGAIAPDDLQALLRRVSDAFPARFRPLARAILIAAGLDEPDKSARTLVALVDALIRRSTLRLHLLKHSSPSTNQALTVDPQLLIPYGEGWYLVGYCHERRRDIMISINELQHVSEPSSRRLPRA